jgi:hypothetical protein
LLSWQCGLHIDDSNFLESNIFAHLPPILAHRFSRQVNANMAEQLSYAGTMVGHSGWVTSLATSLEKFVLRPHALRGIDR